MPDVPELAITPDVKVGALLARWPELESVLVELSPHFEALKNPLLRRTLGRVATLMQAARVSGVPVGTLVNRLRAAVGQAPLALGAGAAGPEAGPRPAWASADAVTRRHDARGEIEAGEHPLQPVLRELSELGPGEVLELVTPFVPAPLVDLARGKGFDTYSAVEGPALVRTWFTPAAR